MLLFASFCCRFSVCVFCLAVVEGRSELCFWVVCNGMRRVFYLDAHEWPVPPPSAYTMMAAQCAGSYSLDTVAQIEELEFMHPNTRCFGGVQHLCTHGGSLNRGLVGQSCGTHRHRTSVDLQSGGPTSTCSATCGADVRAAAVSQHVSTYVAKTMHLGSAACGSRSAYAGVNERVLYVCDLDMRESASCDFWSTHSLTREVQPFHIFTI